MTSHEERIAAVPFSRGGERRYLSVAEWKAKLLAQPPIYKKTDQKQRSLYYYMCPYTKMLIETGLPLPGHVLDDDNTGPDAQKMYGRFKDVCCLYSFAADEKNEHRMTPDLHDRVLRYCQQVLRDPNVPVTPSPRLLRSRGGQWMMRDWEATYQPKAFNFPFTLDRHYRASDEQRHRDAKNPAARMEHIDILSPNTKTCDASELESAVQQATQDTMELVPLLAPGPTVPEFSVVGAAASSSSSSSFPATPSAPKKRKTVSQKNMADAAPVVSKSAKKAKASPMNVDFNTFMSELSGDAAPKKAAAAAKKASSSASPLAELNKATAAAKKAPAKQKKAAVADDAQVAAARALFVDALPKTQQSEQKKPAKKPASAPAAAASSSSARPALPSAKHKLSVKRGGKITEGESVNVFNDLGRALWSEGFAPGGVHSFGFFVLDNKGVLTLSNVSGSFKITVPQ